MLIRLVESVLAGALNRGRRGPPPHPAEETPLVEQAAVPEGHVLLGHEAGTGRAVTLPEAARRRHLYLIGATGSGKTSALLALLDADLARARTAVVLDLRGDLVDRVLARLAASGGADAWGERLVLLDLRAEEWAVGFNPLAGPGQAWSRALHTLAVLRQQADSWGVQLEETLRCALLALAENSDAGAPDSDGPDAGTLADVEPLLTDAGFRARALARVTDAGTRAFFRRYDALGAERQSAWALPVLNKVSPFLAAPALRRMLAARRGLSFTDLLDGPPGRVVLLALAADRLHGAARLAGQLLMSALEAAVMARSARPEAARAPVGVYVDEFEHFAGAQFASLLQEGRRMGCGLTLSHQNLAQLPADLRGVLRGNVGTQLLFQVGAADAAELAPEFAFGEGREAARAALMAQGVGEAHLLRRGEPPVRLRLPPSSDPPADPARVRALREAALSRWGRPAAEVDAELAARARRREECEREGRARERRPAAPDSARPAGASQPPAGATAPADPAVSDDPRSDDPREENPYEVRLVPRRASRRPPGGG